MNSKRATRESETNVPAGWVLATLGDVAVSMKNGLYKPRDAYSSKGVACLRMYNIDNGKLIWKDIKRMTLSQEDVEQYRLLPGDLLVNRVNSRELVGKAMVIPAGIEVCVFESKNIRVRLNSKLINAHFLNYKLLADGRRYFATNAQQVVGMASISQPQIGGFRVPLAPLREQDRIVAEIEKQFTRLDAAVEALKRVRANLKRYRASVLKAACEGRLVPTEADLARAECRDYEPADVLLQRILKERRAKWEADQFKKLTAQGKTPKADKWKETYQEPSPPNTTDLQKLPEGWLWIRAEQLCDFITKGTTPSANKLQSGRGEIPFIKVYNLTDRGDLNFSLKPTFISRKTHREDLARSKVIPGDVLMNIVGPPLGKVSIVPETYSEWNINQAIAVFRPMVSYNRRFLCISLLADHILSWAVHRSKATAGQFNLTLEICRDLPLPLPPLAEQHRIVDELDRRLSIIEELESIISADLKRAVGLRQSILKRAFEGELVPQDPKDEPASVLLERTRAERNAKIQH